MSDALVWLRWVQFIDLALVFGAPLTAVLWGERRVGWRRVLGVASVLGMVCTALYFFAALSAMAASSIGDLDHGLIATMLTGSALGWSVMLRLTALMGVALVAGRRTVALLPVVALSAVAVASLAWGGHAAASQGMAAMVRLGGDCAHLWCALAWLGALMLLVARLWRVRAGEDAALALLAHRLGAFSLIGSVLVAIIALSGIGNLLFLAPPARWGMLARQPYGRWMVAKLAMVALMLMLAAGNRFGLVPALARAKGEHAQRRALAALRCSVSVEMMLALGVTACVALAGTLDPSV